MTSYSATRRWAARVSALLVVIVAAASCSGGSSGGHGNSQPARQPLPDLTDRAVDVTSPLVVDPPAPPAASARAAVESFAAAEIAGDWSTSYGLLVSGDRTTTRGRAGWAAAHAAVPRLRAFAIAGVTQASTTQADVRGDAQFVPRLDEVVGVVPARAMVTWRAIAEDGGWRVAYSQTRVDAQFPSEAGATTAVTAWAGAHQRCEAPPSELEYDAGLVGAPELGSRLCHTTGLTLDPPRALGDRPDPSPVIAAFGPDATTWARLVHVAKPLSLNAVVAPFGDRWIVIGLLADPR